MPKHSDRKGTKMPFIKEILNNAFLHCCIKLTNSGQLCTGKAAAVTSYSAVGATAINERVTWHADE